MLRTISVCEHNVFPTPPKLITLAAATSTQVFPNQSGVSGPEIVFRYIQNNTGQDIYLAFGVNTCKPTAYHIKVADQQVYSAFPDRTAVYAYSVAGGEISAFQYLRVDLGH